MAAAATAHNGTTASCGSLPTIWAGNLRIDPSTWMPDLVIPIYHTAEMSRWHDITFDQDGNMWQVIGNNSKSYAEGKPGLVKYDSVNGQVLELWSSFPAPAIPMDWNFTMAN